MSDSQAAALTREQIAAAQASRPRTHLGNEQAPVPIEDQVKAVRQQVAIVYAKTQKRIARGEAAPAQLQITMAPLRAALATLEAVRDAGTVA